LAHLKSLQSPHWAGLGRGVVNGEFVTDPETGDLMDVAFCDHVNATTLDGRELVTG